MSVFLPTGNEHEFPASYFHFPGFDISWAGESRPWRDGFCFGSEDGRIKFSEFDSPEGPDPIVVAESGEAINGVAFAGDLMAVSTRSEVVFWQVNATDEDLFHKVTYGRGAHGITATPSGNFVAPLGIRGLLFTGPRIGDRRNTMTIKPKGKITNIYKVASLASTPEGEVLTGAARRDGLVTLLIPQGDTNGFIRTLISTDLDVADVCGLDSEDHPLAAAAVGIDRSVHLIRNVLDDRRPPTLRFEGLRGTAYRILSAQGHIFLLTSDWLYVFTGLASRFLGGERPDGPTVVRTLPLQAVDAYLADRRLLIVMPDHTISILIEDLVAGCEEDQNSIQENGRFQVNRPTIVPSAWEECPSFPLEYASV